MDFNRPSDHIYLKKPTAVTIGTFDGVHVGHRKIIDRLLQSAQQHQLEATVLTFFPHPRMVLQQDVGLKLINTIKERKAILKSTGIDNLIVYPFTREFSRMKAQEYIEKILVNKLKAKRVIVGYDHHFGRNRTADINDLRQYGAQYGFEVEEIPEQDIEEVAVSSTKIRKALENGKLEKANRYLGAPFILSGKVKKGKQLGRKLGFPTANLAIKEDYKLIPKGGVYVVKSRIEGNTYFGIMNIGTNPTVGGIEQSIETYFFDWEGDLYGRAMKIKMLKRIRDEENFDNTDALIAAMKKDEIFAKNYIEKHN